MLPSSIEVLRHLGIVSRIIAHVISRDIGQHACATCWEYSIIGQGDPSVGQFDTLHYAGMALCKIGILLCNLVPYVALHLVR